MKFEFIADLDGYFCETYANYDKLCVLPGYRIPKMQDTKEDQFGRKYSYTLPASTMSLAGQEEKEALLAELKSRMTDKNFSFSFRPQGFFTRIFDTFSKTSFRKYCKEIANSRRTTVEELGEGLEIDPKIWKRILSGEFYPSKNLIFALGLSAHLNYREVKSLLSVSGYGFEFEEVLDTVMSYLLSRGVYNAEMVKAAFEEYRLQPLPIKA